mgnify:CR=1 FL=1
MKFKIIAAFIVAGIAIQFIPYGKDHINPPAVSEPQWHSSKTRELFYRACANCHSNTTFWPWYSKIAPISWLIQYDVDEGREHFNVSMWGVQKKNQGHDAAEEVQEGEMPPLVYVIGHPEAKFSDKEKTEFIQGLTATFRKNVKKE